MRMTTTIVALLSSLLLASASLAFNYGDFAGTDVDFLGVTDTTTSPGDNDRLFGGVAGPIAQGNQLIFFPTEFFASSVNGTSDLTSGTLTMMIVSSSAVGIDQLAITEVGDYDLSGVGTAATNVSVSVGGFVTVLEANNAPITPEIIGFSGTFTPDSGFELPGDQGTGLWEGTLLVDIASIVPNATKVMLSLNNIMDANSEQGTTALIQKKVTNGPVLAVSAIVVPEPSAALLFGIGTLVTATSIRGLRRTRPQLDGR